MTWNRPATKAIVLSVVLVVGLTTPASALGGTALSENAETDALSEPVAPAAQEGAVTVVDHPAAVEPGGEFEILVETTDSAGTVVEFDPDGFDMNLSTDDNAAVAVSDTRVEFLDASQGDSLYIIEANISGGASGDSGEISAWVNGEQEADADDSEHSTVEIGDGETANGEITSLAAPETVESDGTFGLTVESTNSAGVVVELDPEAFDVSLSTSEDDAVAVGPNRVEFLDVSGGNSTYQVQVDVENASSGDTGEIVTWVNAGERTNADDEAVHSVEISESKGPPPISGSDPPQDLNGDGLYRDIDGSGEFDVFDVQTLFSNLVTDAVQNNPEAFNFAGNETPDSVTIFDVQALFTDLQQQ